MKQNKIHRDRKMEKRKTPGIAGIILAAGAASRMGRPKLLLPWKGEALIHHAARTALEAELEPLVVVVGSRALDIQASLADLEEIDVVYNSNWDAGQSTSVRAGIKALPEHTEAVIFLLGDQPYVSCALLRALIKTYTQTRPFILAPFVGDKRTNPVLFDRSLFDVLCQLQGDAGARSIFVQYPPTHLPWPDERLLFDVDTPEDYQHLIKFSS
jgi:molybdenum cofactor cytidylyltransferase